jgi:hypothetical protein
VLVTVHIEELHSDVVAAAGPAGGGRRGDEPEPPWVAEARWRELQERAERLAERVCAVDFDD